MNRESIIKKEIRNLENYYDIYLFKEGGWWRAYEWSAYLCRNFISDLNESKRLKPTKKECKFSDDNYIIFVGFPTTSFEKYLPNVYNTENFEEIDNNTITVKAKDAYGNNLNFDECFVKFKEWKDSVDISESKKKSNNKTIKSSDMSVNCDNPNNHTEEIIKNINSLKHSNNLDSDIINDFVNYINSSSSLISKLLLKMKLA